VLNPRYAFISACLKGEEPKTVTSEHIDKMMTASNLQDALATIRETNIGSYLEELPVRTFDTWMNACGDISHSALDMWNHLSSCPRMY
jgi:hypothetical protein